MRPQNLLFILSDQHNPRFLGGAGHPVVETPNLDRLAQRGTRFTRATTPSPICVPARASFATGRYVHQIGAWDNAHPYGGSPDAWGHPLIAQGHRVAAIGKLHYRSDADANGFSEKIETMNVLEGVGDRLGLLRHLHLERGSAKDMALTAGSGESTYTRYDRRVADAACNWLRERAAAPDAKPWVLFVGFVMPHLPLIAPPEFFNMYAAQAFAAESSPDADQPQHPWLEWLTRVIPYGKYFEEESRRKAIAAYHGMVTFLDHNIGLLMAALDETGLSAETRIIYTSDHGEMLGEHGIWGKCCMYEDSVGVPLIMAGSGIAEGGINATEVSLVDCFPTILDAVGADVSGKGYDALPGKSLFRLLGGTDESRLGFSEYHAVGARTGCFMVRRGRWKLVHYEGLEPQLFDLVSDPREMTDLAADPGFRAIRAEFEAALRRIVDPEAATARAFADQRATIAKLGGEAAILDIGDFGHTPAPGETPRFARHVPAQG